MTWTRDEAQAVVSATLGYRRYLNGLDDKMYWSDFRDDDDRDDPKGGPFFTTQPRP